MDRFGTNFSNVCVKGAYNHRKERRKEGYKLNCSDIPVPFVFDASDNEKMPWPNDFPKITVEHLLNSGGVHLLNSGGVRLSSILFDNGNETHRSYADGLLQMDESTITHSFSCFACKDQKLVPFLAEERHSFLSNAAGRTAEEINQEVLPVLDRPR